MSIGQHGVGHITAPDVVLSCPVLSCRCLPSLQPSLRPIRCSSSAHRPSSTSSTSASLSRTQPSACLILRLQPPSPSSPVAPPSDLFPLPPPSRRSALGTTVGARDGISARYADLEDLHSCVSWLESPECAARAGAEVWNARAPAAPAARRTVEADDWRRAGSIAVGAVVVEEWCAPMMDWARARASGWAWVVCTEEQR